MEKLASFEIIYKVEGSKKLVKIRFFICEGHFKDLQTKKTSNSSQKMCSQQRKKICWGSDGKICGLFHEQNFIFSFSITKKKLASLTRITISKACDFFPVSRLQLESLKNEIYINNSLRKSFSSFLFYFN